MMCRGCSNSVTTEEIENWDEFCEECLETGRNFDDNIRPLVEVEDYSI